ncbi:MAG: aldo/keto reductase [Oscillospiraceae bacterium]|jgi:predicted aldo/keto reductase-like oxidoreductase|nr:aldo/keto reductase [Oscillospiraceae bacterium]
MIYRNFGKTGIKMSSLGFGAMRLPMVEKDGAKIVNYELATPLMQRAFELGVNYIDTAPFYCDSDSEAAVGKALKGWRDKIYLSTKYPTENASGDDMRSWLEKSLTRLDTNYIDFYHMWGINIGTMPRIDVKGGVLDSARKANEEGLIRHISFSFHDKAENMFKIIDTGIFESVLCQYNLLDRTLEDAIQYAKEKGLGTVIMGPVGGGRLGAPSDVIKSLLSRDVKSSAEMAMRFVISNPNIDVALSGMQDLHQLEENAKIAAIEGALTNAEIEQINAMMAENKKLAQLYCTGCNYCLPCPKKINIPHIFSLMNYHKVYELTDFSKAEYQKLYIPLENRKASWEIGWGVDAGQCAECGICEEKCPQKLKITEQLRDTHETIGGKL